MPNIRKTLPWTVPVALLSLWAAVELFSQQRQDPRPRADESLSSPDQEDLSNGRPSPPAPRLDVPSASSNPLSSRVCRGTLVYRNNGEPVPGCQYFSGALPIAGDPLSSDEEREILTTGPDGEWKILTGQNPARVTFAPHDNVRVTYDIERTDADTIYRLELPLFANVKATIVAPPGTTWSCNFEPVVNVHGGTGRRLEESVSGHYGKITVNTLGLSIKGLAVDDTFTAWGQPGQQVAVTPYSHGNTCVPSRHGARLPSDVRFFCNEREGDTEFRYVDNDGDLMTDVDSSVYLRRGQEALDRFLMYNGVAFGPVPPAKRGDLSAAFRAPDGEVFNIPLRPDDDRPAKDYYEFQRGKGREPISVRRPEGQPVRGVWGISPAGSVFAFQEVAPERLGVGGVFQFRILDDNISLSVVQEHCDIIFVFFGGGGAQRIEVDGRTRNIQASEPVPLPIKPLFRALRPNQMLRMEIEIRIQHSQGPADQWVRLVSRTLAAEDPEPSDWAPRLPRGFSARLCTSIITKRSTGGFDVKELPDRPLDH